MEKLSAKMADKNPKEKAEKTSSKNADVSSWVNPLWQNLAFSECATTAYLQRKCVECDEFPADNNRFIQSKLALGPVNDAYEQEADAVADRVMRTPAAVAQTPMQLLSMDVNARYESPLQRSCVECEESTLQRSAALNRSAMPVPSPTQRVVESPDSGHCLDKTIRSRVEAVLGTNLSDVRVHTNTEAQKAAQNINAHAFTHKNEIFLGPNQSAKDLKLMAHEITHTQQQATNLSSATDNASAANENKVSALRRTPASNEQAGEEATQDNEFQSLTIDPIQLIIQVKHLINNPIVRRVIKYELGEQAEKLFAVLNLDEAMLQQVSEFIASPEENINQLANQLQPLVDQIPALVDAKAHELLAQVGLANAPMLRVLAEIAKQLAQMGTEWRQVVSAILIDTFMIWDWSAQVQEIADLNKKSSEQGVIDGIDWYLAMARILLGGLDRILGFIDIVLFLLSLVSGTGLGAGAGGAAGGVGGGVVGAGVGAAPGAAAGGGTGAGVGVTAGTGVGATIHAALGGASLAAGITIEAEVILKAAGDLSLTEQNNAQIDEDYQQIASSLIGLGTMLAMFVLGPFAARIGKTLSARLKALASALTDDIEIPNHASPTNSQHPASSDSAPVDVVNDNKIDQPEIDLNLPTQQLTDAQLLSLTQTRVNIGDRAHDVQFRQKNGVICEICTECKNVQTSVGEMEATPGIKSGTKDELATLSETVSAALNTANSGVSVVSSVVDAAVIANEMERIVNSESRLVEQINLGGVEGVQSHTVTVPEVVKVNRPANILDPNSSVVPISDKSIDAELPGAEGNLSSLEQELGNIDATMQQTDAIAEADRITDTLNPRSTKRATAKQVEIGTELAALDEETRMALIDDGNDFDPRQTSVLETGFDDPTAEIQPTRLSAEVINALRKATPSKAWQDYYNDGSQQLDYTTLQPIVDVVLPDHIFPFKKIIELEGFSSLEFEQQKQILNMKENFAPMSEALNSSKSDRMMSDWFDTELGKTVPIDRRSMLIDMQETARNAVEIAIESLLKVQ